MKTNESGIDRGIRVLFGIVLLALFFSGVVTGVLGVISIVVGVVLLLTGVVGFCPLYALLNIHTKKS